MINSFVMKKVILALFALAVAIGVGIAVFKWTGSDLDELRRKGNAIEEKLRQTGHGGSEPSAEAKKPESPGASTPAQAVPPSQAPAAPPPTTAPKKKLAAPPMEEVNDKDKDQLKGILKQ